MKRFLPILFVLFILLTGCQSAKSQSTDAPGKVVEVPGGSYRDISSSELKSMLDNTELWRNSPDLVRLMNAVQAMGIGEYVRFDANIVRGLLYYTGTVFEANDLSGDIRRSILGGGRYNNLLSDVGGEDLPAVGFAMGDVTAISWGRWLISII